MAKYPEHRGICASCDRDRGLYDVGAYDGVSRFCFDCIKKFGAEVLAAASNAALAARQIVPQPRTTCLRCDAPLIVGSRGLYCNSCNKAYQERFGTSVKWG